MEAAGVSGDIAVGNLKMEAFRKNFLSFQEQSSSLFMLSLQWKDLEDHYAALQDAIDKKRESVREIFLDVEAKQDEFRVIQALIECRCKELDSMVEEFVEKHRLVVEETANVAGREIERRLAEIEGEGKKYESQCADLLRLVDEQFCEVMSREKHVKAASAELNRRLEYLNLKERMYGERLREFELENCRFDCEQRLKFEEFNSKNKELEERYRELESRENKFNLDQHEFAERLIDLDSREFDFGERSLRLETTRILFEADMALLDQRQRDFGLKMEKFNLEIKEFKSRVKEFEEREKCAQINMGELDSREKQVEVQEKELLSPQRAFDQRAEDFKLMEKIFEQQSMECNVKADECQEGKLAGRVDIDGLKLQIFLNENKDEDRIHDKVLFLLRMCRDPAKVVLEAMEGFFRPHLKKGDEEFKGSVVRQSCIILLEQLMKISPDISDDIKSDATKLSSNWFAKLRPVHELDCHILGFLFLLATYRCHGAFHLSDLIPLVEIVAHRRQAPELCRILGFRYQIRDIIKNLLGKKQCLPAIRFACAFDLRSEFQLERILNDYIETSRTRFKAVYHGESSTLEEKTKAIDKRISDLEAAKRCIVDFNLRVGYCPEIDNDIRTLKKQLPGLLNAVAANVKASKGMEPNSRELCSPEIPPAPLNSTTTANSSLTQRAVNAQPSGMMLPERNNIKLLHTVMAQRGENRVNADSGVRVMQEAGPEQQIGSTIPQDMAKSEDVRPANLPAGSKRKPSEGCYEDQNASLNNSTIRSNARRPKKRKTKLIAISDPNFVPPPPSCGKFNPKHKRFRPMNSGPFVKRTGRVQFSDIDNPYNVQNLSTA